MSDSSPYWVRQSSWRTWRSSSFVPSVWRCSPSRWSSCPANTTSVANVPMTSFRWVTHRWGVSPTSNRQPLPVLVEGGLGSQCCWGEAPCISVVVPSRTLRYSCVKTWAVYLCLCCYVYDVCSIMTITTVADKRLNCFGTGDVSQRT